MEPRPFPYVFFVIYYESTILKFSGIELTVWATTLRSLIKLNATVTFRLPAGTVMM